MSKKNNHRSRPSQPPTRVVHAVRNNLIDLITGEILDESFTVSDPVTRVRVPTPHLSFLTNERHQQKYRDLQVARRLRQQPEARWRDPLNQIWRTGYQSETRIQAVSPRSHVVCCYRQLRRAILFRRRKIGRGSSRTAYPKLSLTSLIRCT